MFVSIIIIYFFTLTPMSGVFGFPLAPPSPAPSSAARDKRRPRRGAAAAAAADESPAAEWESESTRGTQHVLRQALLNHDLCSWI